MRLGIQLVDLLFAQAFSDIRDGLRERMAMKKVFLKNRNNDKRLKVCQKNPTGNGSYE